MDSPLVDMLKILQTKLVHDAMLDTSTHAQLSRHVIWSLNRQKINVSIRKYGPKVVDLTTVGSLYCNIKTGSSGNPSRFPHNTDTLHVYTEPLKESTASKIHEAVRQELSPSRVP